MSWRDDLRRVTLSDGRRLIGASFRGIPFLVDVSERGGGRRAVVHEFPLRDDPFVEDLGRRARTFRVDGYVLGDEYIAERDALLAALEDVSGPGELVHPSHGVRRAICTGLSTRETIVDGGMAIFSIEFTEAPAQSLTPTEVPDPAGQVAASADTAITATEDEFVEKYDVDGLPSFALASAQTALTSATAALKEKLSPVVRDTQELAALNGQLNKLTTTASSLVRQPTEVLGEFREAITGLLETAVNSPEAVMDALADAYTIDLGSPAPETTATRERERANQLVLVGSLRRILAIEAARLIPLVPFESIEEATEARDTVADMLEEQAGIAGDTAYPALVTLRSEVLQAVPGASVFARLITVTRRVPIPSLLLSYQLYGNVDQELDIVARNHVPHPGFMSGDIQVLSSE